MSAQVRTDFGQHPSIREATNEEKRLVLEFDDAGPNANGYWRYEVLESIQFLLMGSYALNLNPLRDLREFFPNFEWRFHDLDAFDDTSDTRGWKRAFRKIAVEADFLWKIHGGSINTWVTASRKDKQPKRLRIFGSGTIDEVLAVSKLMHGIDLVNFLKQECGMKDDPFYVKHGWKVDSLSTVVKRPAA